MASFALSWTIFVIIWGLYERYRTHLYRDETEELRAENRILTRHNELLRSKIDQLNKVRTPQAATPGYLRREARPDSSR